MGHALVEGGGSKLGFWDEDPEIDLLVGLCIISAHTMALFERLAYKVCSFHLFSYFNIEFAVAWWSYCSKAHKSGFLFCFIG
jgi:hypothetical protein